MRSPFYMASVGDYSIFGNVQPLLLFVLALFLHGTEYADLTMKTTATQLDVQGHRGARGLYPENTLTAFSEALKLGITTLEMDVVVSKDRLLVVSHEPWMSPEICTRPDGTPVKKGTEKKHNLYAMTYGEIRQYDCGKRGNPRFPEQKPVPEHKPLLREVLEMAERYAAEHGRQVYYNIETKCTAKTDDLYHPDPALFTALLYEELDNLNVLDRVIIQSFDVRTLQELRRMDPAVTISLLSENRLGHRKNMNELGFRPDIYSPDYHLLSKKAVEELHKEGIAVLPWTVNDPEDMKKLVEMGVDGFITDYPDRAAKAGYLNR
jgi:glycerophosphoryl diester phosphodiesterase